MKKVKKVNNLFKSIGFLSKISLFLGIFCVVLGTVLVTFSFRYEVLDSDYLIVDIKEDTFNDLVNLSDGEVSVFGESKYIRDGVFKITFTNYAKKNGNSDVVRENTYFKITDNLGEGYELYDKEIIINDREYKFDGKVTSQENITFEYENKTVLVSIPSNLVYDSNSISFYIVLTGRELNVEYNTTKDTYYSFEPGNGNNFYSKSGFQSYIIDGVGYIKLSKK